MNKRIKNKLTKNIKRKRKAFRCGVRIPLTRAERKLVRKDKVVTLLTIGDALKGQSEKSKGLELPLEATKEIIEFMTKEETWEERINRIDSYKFDNPTPIKVHKSPTVWDKIKDKLKEWLR